MRLNHDGVITARYAGLRAAWCVVLLPAVVDR